MAGAGSRSRERVQTIDEVRENGFSNVMQATFGGEKYLLAVKDSVQVDLTSFHTESELRTWVMGNLASVRMFDINSRGKLTRELSRTQISELPIPEEAAETAAQAPTETEASARRGATRRADQIFAAIDDRDFTQVTYLGRDGKRHSLDELMSKEAMEFLGGRCVSDPDSDKYTESMFFKDMLISFLEHAGTGRVGMEALADIFKKMVSESAKSEYWYGVTEFYNHASGAAGAQVRAIFKRAYDHFWEDKGDGTATLEYIRPRAPASAATEETAAQVLPAPVVEHLRLGKETNARTRQIIRAFESRTYEGITFPGTGGARAEFFQQFSEQEMAFLQRAWDFAGTKERELFAAELNAFFAETGDGRMGMMTLAKILQRMASDYLSHQGAYAQARFFTIADFYYYASDIMEGEKTVGGAREHSVGSIGRAMRGAVHRRYISLVDELKEERRSAIIRRLPGLEQVPTPAGGVEAAAATAEAASAEAAEAAVEAVQAPSAIDRMYARYSQVEFYQHMISRLPENSPQLPNLRASMRAAEDSFLEFVQAQPQDVQDAARARVRRINDRRAAELSAPATATQTEAAGGVAVPATEEAAAAVEEAPAEEPATAAVESAPAEAAQAEVYDYERFFQILRQIRELAPGANYSSSGIFDIPVSGEELHALYLDIKAHFADIDAVLAAGGLTDNQVVILDNLKIVVSSALAGE